ncbi:uncharacterized protein [Rutidosis leptorrhynchoides]
MWVGSTWTCRKKRKHYEGYCHKGIRISAHDFVYVLAEQSRRLVAYLDDLYEDCKGNKMAVVRWFHKVDEVGLDLPHNKNNYNDKEIYFSLCLQAISIKCIDGLATVLSPQHFITFLKTDTPSILNHPFVCRYQVDNEALKPFDITQVKGYWKQNVHKFMSTEDDVEIRPKKRLRRLVDGELNYQNWKLADGFVGECKHEYSIGSEIEVLSLDSGIRGMWLKAVVIKKHKDKLKVRYLDIKDASDESKNLEEWILSSRVADNDELGIRHSGRMMVRPSRWLKTNINNKPCLVDVGYIVDAWLHDDGWWEGIVVKKESNDKIHVYLPGEKQTSIISCKYLRRSEEWLGDRWKKLKARPDLLASIKTGSRDSASFLTGMNCEKEVNNRNSNVDKDLAGLIRCLSWNWSTKKRRCYATNNDELLTEVETKKGDGSRFCAPVGSPSLTRSLVMSR